MLGSIALTPLEVTLKSGMPASTQPMFDIFFSLICHVLPSIGLCCLLLYISISNRNIMDVSGFLKEQRSNHRLSSEFPEKLKDTPCFLGIDEAGRGPVLGPMVYATCVCPISFKDQLAELGCDDSKVLKEDQRDELFVKLNSHTQDFIAWVVHILSPEYISKSMLSKNKYNLNSISHDTAIGLIKFVQDNGIQLTEVYVDTVGSPESYQAKLKQRFPTIDITVESKADATYPIVSAASICAKVCRDKTVKTWNFGENGNKNNEYGSGYPSDPKTKSWLRSNVDPVFGFSNFVRFSWSTARNILQDEAVEVDWPEDEAQDGSTSSIPTITSFFRTPDQKNRDHVFFLNHGLSSANSF